MSRLPSIGLMMIVKNEAKTLPRLVESVKPLITHWTIIDTGSTDGTQQIVQNLLADLPGELKDEPWVNFGVNRSSLISRFPADCEFALLLDADQVVNCDNKTDLANELAKQPEAQIFMIEVQDASYAYRMPYLVRRGPNYRFVGATHEFLDADTRLQRGEINTLSIHHVGDGGSKSDKYDRDVRLLSDAIARGEDNPRNHFYLAQSFQCLGKNLEAEREYLVVSGKSAWDEERYLASLRAGRIAAKDGRADEAIGRLEVAIAACPDRHEARFELAKLHSSKKQFATALAVLRDRSNFPDKTRILFVEGWIAQWATDLEIGVQLWHIGDVVGARKVFLELKARVGLPPHAISLIEKNLTYCS